MGYIVDMSKMIQTLELECQNPKCKDFIKLQAI